MVKFLRRTWSRYAKLGKGRKKKQVWRRPTGRDNKMREKRRGYPVVVSVGYKQGDKVRGIIEKKKPVRVMNVKDLGKIGKNEIAVVGNVGNKKRMEIAKEAKKMKIEIYNLNAEKFLKKKEEEAKKKKEEKEKKAEDKESKSKGAKQKKDKKEVKKSKGTTQGSPNTVASPKETKQEIVEDIKESGVSEKVAKAEEALDEREQLEGKKE